MHVDDWKRVDQILDSLIGSDGGRTPAADTQRIADACGDRADLIPIITSMLAEHAGEQDFMSASAKLTPAAAGPDHHAPLLPAGSSIGPWKIDRVIGRGGMGEVYLAQRDDGQYRQQAALKILASTADDHAARFLHERQILADLDHPGLAKLLDGGVDEHGRPYMAMEYIEGEQLLDYCRKHKPSLRDRLELFISLCEVVSYAHQRLIVHRDIKPGNVLVTADGTPRLLDFGIATLAREAVGDGALTQALVTPNYAAPEQLAGRGVTTATDIHALGALLHALLTNGPPWDLQTVPLPVAIQRVLQQDPPKPSTLAARAERPPIAPSKLSGDLDAICAKAMRKRPQDRYASASSLANDVRRHLNAEPVTARDGNTSYVVQRFLRRNWIAASVASLFAAVVMGALVVTTWYANTAAQERDIARRDSARVETLRSATAQLLQSAIELNEQERVASGAPPEEANLFVRAADALRDKHADSPQLTATTDHVLGQLFFAKDDMLHSGPLLKRAAEYNASEVEPDLLAEARYDYAQWLYFDGQLEASKPYTQQAVEFWQQDPARYRAELIWSSSMRARYLRADGDAQGAYAVLRSAADAAERHWGLNHPETAVVYNTLGFQSAEMGHYDQSAQEYQTAVDIWAALGKLSSPESVSSLANLATQQTETGDLVSATHHLQQARDTSRSLYGDTVIVSILSARLARLRSLSGDIETRLAAQEEGDRALLLINEQLAPSNHFSVAARCQVAQARANAQSEQQIAAGIELLRAVSDQDTNDDRATFHRGVCKIALAHHLIDRGAVPEASRISQSIASDLAVNPSRAARTEPLHLHVQARLLMDTAPDQAIQLLSDAAEQLSAVARDTHYALEMIRADAGLAMALGGDRDAGRAKTRGAVDSLQQQFGPDHAYAVRARERLAAINAL